MDEKLIRRNLLTSGLLCVLCLAMCLLALFFRWTEIAIVMAVLALLQAYMACVWLNKKRKPQSHFRKKQPRRS
ncbi:MAG TPA: hypothetical protein H9972_07475 [Candidatus Paraprevotella stercorigallinarum]|nr:hypothetical protein [Candidatus Paraprevotella stercorigallinarum]